MRSKPPDRTSVTLKPYANQPGNKITGQGEVLLPILLLVFPLRIKPVTEGNVFDPVSRPLNKYIEVYGFTLFSIFLKGCLVYYRYFCYQRCICMYSLGKSGNKRGNKIGNVFGFVTPWLY